MYVLNKKCRKVQFRVNNSVIENVSEYKYLEMTINAAGSLSPTLGNSSEKARRTIFALNNQFSLKRLPVRIALKLFDSYISPILLYGLQIWMPFHQTDFNEWDITKIEFVHLKFCKHILGVNRSTSNILVRGEVRGEMHENQCSDTFTGYINALSHDIGAQRSKGIESYSKAKVKYMIYDHYQKIWELSLNLNPKARFYHSFKVDIKFEPYLNIICDRSLRVVLSKFRLSDHELNIETGRHHNIKHDERYCPFCNDNSIEDEYHILF